MIPRTAIRQIRLISLQFCASGTAGCPALPGTPDIVSQKKLVIGIGTPLPNSCHSWQRSSNSTAACRTPPSLVQCPKRIERTAHARFRTRSMHRSPLLNLARMARSQRRRRLRLRHRRRGTARLARDGDIRRLGLTLADCVLLLYNEWAVAE